MAKPTSTGNRKRRLRLAAVLVAVAVGVVAALAGAAYAQVSTDQQDYSPGSLVTVSGDNDSTGNPGYVQGHTVTVDATNIDTGWTGSCSTTITATDGSWSCAFDLSADSTQAVGTYTYTATSTDANGDPISESGTFTDAISTRIISAALTPSSPTTSDSVSFTGTLQYHSTGTTYAALAGKTVSVTGPYASATGSGGCGQGGGTTVGSDTTDSSGDFTVTVGTLTTGTHWFQASYAGDGPSGTYGGTDVCASVTVNAVSDTTAPTTTITLDPSSPDGSNGWYVSDVNVTITATDPDDTVAVTRCVLDPATTPTSFSDLPTTTCPYLGPSGADVTTDGMHTIYAASEDSNGNIESIKSASFKVDETPPTVSVTGFTNGDVFVKGVDTLPTVGCARSDATSGIDASGSTGPSITAGGLNANGVGSVTYSCGARDNAGNTNSASSSYSVVYDWTGFFQPVNSLTDSQPWNSAKAGSAIPVKFNLGGDQSLDIFNEGYPKVIQIACPSGGTVSDPIETYTTSTAGGSTLTYDTTAMQYIYVWKTQKAWSGKCFLFQLGLNDGTTHNFQVQFTK